VRTPAGTVIGDAVVVLPGAYAELAVSQQYQILGPASVRADVGPERLTPYWIIDSGGLALAPAIQTPLLAPQVDTYPRVSAKQPAITADQEESAPC
jgi:hypothetical protein